MLSLLAAAALLGALLWIYNAFSSTYRGAIGAIALYFVFIVAGRRLSGDRPQVYRGSQ